jgi:hypothetical protein
MDDSSASKWAVVGVILASTLGAAWLALARIGKWVGVTERDGGRTLCERLIDSPATYLGVAAVVILAAVAWQALTGSIGVGRFSLDHGVDPRKYWLVISFELICAAAIVRFAVALAIG